MKKYHWALLTGVIAVAFAAILIKKAEAPSIIIATYRLGIAAIVITPVALLRTRNELKQLKIKYLLLAFGSGAFLAFHFVLWITSLNYTSVTSSVVLVTASPIFVAIASYIIFKERITSWILTGILITVIGAAVIGFNSWVLGGASVKGSILALSGAMAITGYLLIGRNLRQKLGILSYVFLTYWAAAVVLLVWALIVGGSFIGYSGMTYLMLILLALVPQLIGHSSLNWSLRFVPATLVTIAVLGEPVGATILALAILKEVPSLYEIIGGVLILGGIVIAFCKPTSSHRG